MISYFIWVADPFALQHKIEETVRRNGEAAIASLDRKMISQLNDVTSQSKELKGLLSEGLLKHPSKNCISLMTTSGAKGGAVSFSHSLYMFSGQSFVDLVVGECL